MKIATICWLGLLPLIIGSTVTAQRKVIRPPSPSCDGYSNVIEWGAQYRFFPCHWGFNPYEVILSPATVGNLALDWTYTMGGDSQGVLDQSSPVVANGVVYVGSIDGNLYALNAGTGALLWKYTTGSAVDSSPAVANGVVYVGSDDNNLYALNASTGALLWKYMTELFR